MGGTRACTNALTHACMDACMHSCMKVTMWERGRKQVYRLSACAHQQVNWFNGSMNELMDGWMKGVTLNGAEGNRRE